MLPGIGGGATAATAATAVSQPSTSHHTVQVVPDSDVTDTDVLTGRGALVDRSPGNVRFRLLIKSKKKAYSDSISHKDKKIVVRQVIQAVRESNGRFLKTLTTAKAAGSALYRSPTTWVLMEEAAIEEKVKQAFRDCAKEKPKSKASPEKRAPRSPAVKKTAHNDHQYHDHPRDSDSKTSPRDSKGLPDEEAEAVEQHVVPGLLPPMVLNTPEPQAKVPTTPRVSPDHLLDPQLLANKLRELQNSTNTTVPPPPPPPLPPPALPEARSSPWQTPLAHYDANNGNATAAAAAGASTVHTFQQLGSQGGPWSAVAAVAASHNPLVPPPPPLPIANTTSGSYPPPLPLWPPPPLVPQLATVQPPLMGLPGLAVSWRDIPDGFLLVLLGPSSLEHICTLPFTSADFDLLRTVRLHAESAGDVLCLAKLRAVWQAVRQLPPSRLHLTPSELHTLFRNMV
jgi:hypothetical protein